MSTVPTSMIVSSARRLFCFFIHGRWLKLARLCLVNKRQLMRLLKALPAVILKRSLRPVFADLLLLRNYVVDVARGRYIGFDSRNLILIVALLIYVVSPLDIVPDWLAGIGYFDDVSLVAYVSKLLGAELERYRKQMGKQASREV